jgi:hypothetical protein
VFCLRPRDHRQPLPDAAGAALRPVALRDDLEVIADRAPVHAGSGEDDIGRAAGRSIEKGRSSGPSGYAPSYVHRVRSSRVREVLAEHHVVEMPCSWSD